MLSTEKWLLGGTNPVEDDYFNGKLDDVRFYQKALTAEEIVTIANDDITNSVIAGYDNQIIYDEGSSDSGFSIGLEHGILKARVVEGGETIEVKSDTKISGEEWSHLLVSFGESPKSFNLFLNGNLEDGPILLNSSSTISGQTQKPRIGNMEATSAFPNHFGFYKGDIDEVRIYDRGLGIDEVEKIYAGDFQNEGFIRLYCHR